jgi:hypothetical protein
MSAELRRQIYTILIVIAAGMVAGRILSTNFNYEPAMFRDPANPEDTRTLWPDKRPRPVPSFSSNDRSRWATIRALVENGTYVIGQRETVDPQTKAYKDTGITFEMGFGGVDRVLNPEPDPDRPNIQYFYSSKPTLLPTLLAGEYWLLKNILGWTFATHFYSIVRIILLTVNWLPLIVYWVLLARLIERFGGSDWGKLFVFAAACFGTMLNTFAITLNNHTIAACAALYAVYQAAGIWTNPAEGRPLPFLVAGLCASFAAAVELPALAFLVGLFVLLLWKAPRPTLVGFVPPALVVVAASLLTNYLAIGRLTPAYAEVGQKSKWYLYEGSHWLEVPGKEKTGIDFAWKKENRATYVFHFLFGHHGIFLLSPIYLLSMAGMYWVVRNAFRRRSADDKLETLVDEEKQIPPETKEIGSRGVVFRAWLQTNPFAMVICLTVYLTIVVVGFYLVKTDNYGGFSSGPRWVFWLTPFWLLAMLPAVDRLASGRWGRALALGMLAVSVFSVSFPAWNPWRHPWLYQWLDAQGWIPY